MPLPEWKVKTSTAHKGWLLIRCPRRDCRMYALVKLTWPEGGFPSRPCTYCFKANRIPGREPGPRAVR